MILICYELCYQLSPSKTLKKLNFCVIIFLEGRNVLINVIRISFYSSFLVLKTRLSKSPFPR